jgi:hypothetical protein
VKLLELSPGLKAAVFIVALLLLSLELFLNKFESFRAS